jgi:Zn-dependent membrane protease YugP
VLLLLSAAVLFSLVRVGVVLDAGVRLLSDVAERV